ncbi:MAG TPA: O-antigen ligase family protein, partial [Planctomycetota bacterium]|nr:O-antigen ligase family protein [Planctomycetota bacterium]
MEDRFERPWLTVALAVVAAKACLSTLSMSVSAGAWTSWVSINFLTSTLILVPLGACLVRRSRSEPTVRVSGLEVAPAALGLWALASALWAREPGPAAMYGIEFLSIAAVMFVLAQSARGDDVWRTLIGIWIFGLLVGAAQYWIGFDAEAREIMRQQHEQTGSHGAESIALRAVPSIYIYVNLFAAMLILLVGALAGAVWDARTAPPPQRATLGLALAGALLMLWLTRSRAAHAALALAGLISVGWVLYRIKPRLALIPAAIAAGLVVVGGLRLLYTSRMDIWASAIEVGSGAPIFGVGAGNFASHYLSVRAPEAINSPFAFNDYLQIFCELGIVGLGALIGFWAAGLRIGAPMEAKSESSESSPWTASAGIAAGLVLAWMIGGHHPAFRIPLFALL